MCDIGGRRLLLPPFCFEPPFKSSGVLRLEDSRLDGSEIQNMVDRLQVKDRIEFILIIS